MAAKKTRKIKVYACGVDWQHEMGEVGDHTKVYSTVECLKEQRRCWKQCGIVELEVSLVQWMEEQDFSRPNEED